ncbi:MAG: methylated-DNA--[protein]-cysteine S-methyltransferase [Devosia sp.]|uniref:methylated-DNA--[protein]-cysteine S-methyltransferase n=1 Tax=Devosia sp. TaxID=1871048 RepID=UPI00261C4FDE|nr:methylated-DNA--[protein]-cysteine S-methyltransferase [Devosia sp.]MDB5528542.1 methylated-DNA--[protein]-cysteine S-methyltransferase [Devosia sp.]
MQICVFETELGVFGLGWTEAGIARAHLPGLSGETVEARLLRHGAEVAEPPAAIQGVMAMVRDYARGVAVDFSGVPLDLEGLPEFHRRAYELLVQIGYGETTTYGALARQLGDVSLSRAVGQAMGANRIPLIIPCHRVLASDGKPGGFSAPGGAASKLRMLALEGVQVGPPDTGQQSFAF